MALKIVKSYFFLFFIICACSTNEEVANNDSQEPEVESSKPNILLIIADDMGLDASPGYNIGSVKPNMPTLQELIRSGIKFNNVWSYPVCSPTRASILTGKYGFRTGVLKAGDVLSTSEVSIQKHLDNNSSEYNHAVIGKWHLSSNTNHPNDMGIDYYTGLLSGGVQSYWSWNLTTNGQTSASTEYTTSKFTDLAIDWINNQSQPWFLWLAYNAPHTPFHLPPNELHYQGNLSSDQASIDANPLPYYMAMLEAMDTEMGRLLNSMSQEEKDNTIIVFIGDNGTPNQVVQEFSRFRAKGSVYQGGVNVPMVISGKGISRINDTENALVGTTDLFATIADIAEIGTKEIHDSKSFKELFTTSNPNFRDYVYSEVQEETGEINYTIRNTTHKYIYFDDGSEALYNLSNDALESTNLLNANQLPLSSADVATKAALIAKLNEIRGS